MSDELRAERVTEERVPIKLPIVRWTSGEPKEPFRVVPTLDPWPVGPVKMGKYAVMRCRVERVRVFGSRRWIEQNRFVEQDGLVRSYGWYEVELWWDWDPVPHEDAR